MHQATMRRLSSGSATFGEARAQRTREGLDAG